MNTPLRHTIVAGTVVYLVHFAVAVAMFLSVHLRGGAQAEFAWFLFMELDFPTSTLAWEHLAETRPLVALTDWGYTWGSGANLRALFIHGVIGGIQWFLLGAMLGYFFAKKRKGLLARGKAREA